MLDIRAIWCPIFPQLTGAHHRGITPELYELFTFDIIQGERRDKGLVFGSLPLCAFHDLLAT